MPEFLNIFIYVIGSVYSIESLNPVPLTLLYKNFTYDWKW